MLQRKSPLALKQADLVAELIRHKLSFDVELLPMSTTGDRQTSWSLQDKGGKGLFTKELESALLENRADIAVHSAKDLPTENPNGLTLAAFLKREDPRDVLVKKNHSNKNNCIWKSKKNCTDEITVSISVLDQN